MKRRRDSADEERVAENDDMPASMAIDNDNDGDEEKHPGETSEENATKIALKIEEKKRKNSAEKIEDRRRTLRAFIVALQSLCIKSSETLEAGIMAVVDEVCHVEKSNFSAVSDAIFDSILMFPGKSGIYGTLVGLFNVKPETNEIAQTIAREKLVQKLCVSLRSHDYVAVRQLLRFMTDLCNAGVVAVDELSRCHAAIIDAAEAMPTRPGAAHCIHSVLITMPLLRNGTVDRKLVERCGKFVKEAKGEQQPLLQMSADPESPVPNVLATLWAAIESIGERRLHVAVFPRPYRHMAKSLEGAVAIPLDSLDRVNACAVEGIEATLSSDVLRCDLTLFDSEHEYNAEIKPLERCVLSEFVHDSIVTMHDAASEVSKELLSLTAEDFVYHHIICETFFSCLFHLPHATVPEVALSAIMVNLFKATASIHPVVGRSINEVFGLVDTLDAQCRDRFIQWFSFHIAQFDFNWAWPAWSPVVEMSEASLSKQVLKQMLEYGCRIAYWDTVSSKIPPEFVPLLPAKPEAALRELPPDSGAAIIDLLKRKATATDIVKWLDTNSAGSSGAERVRLVVPVMLRAGQKSYIHSFTLLDRNSELLRSIAPHSDDEAQRAIVDEVTHCWSTVAQHQSVLLGLLQRLDVIIPKAIVDWAFDQRDRYWRYDLWETVWMAIEQADCPSALLVSIASRFVDIVDGDDPEGDADAEEHGTTPSALALERFRQFVRSYHQQLAEFHTKIDSRVTSSHPHSTEVLQNLKELNI